MLDAFARFPRAPLAHLPTPFSEMKRLRAALQAEGHLVPRLFIKRDDCTGLADGGNKTRKLEFLIGEALAQGADTIVTTGALQSNHARQTAAAAITAGIRPVLVLLDMVPYQGRAYRHSGNLLLDDIMGAEVRIVPQGANPAVFIKGAIDEISAADGKPFFVPTGGSNATGSLGYAAAYFEIADALDALGIANARIIHGSSSGGTQAGLVAGAALRGRGPAVHGINVYRGDHAAMKAGILSLARATAEALGAPSPADEAVILEEGFLGRGYGMPTAAMIEAVELIARNEGILLDPVYTGKAMAGLLALIRTRSTPPEEALVFLHTGGMPGLFAYEEEFTGNAKG
ncbi:pyridoxal-phosphate dependent enzyme [Parvibaculum sedimenti]|uniref:Pyridoxal-phosphate dependent enzyme n=1 Tax=Parvibaculum sedimenti TaxID=2608632 RepID=A0A6N6VK14_9HYPH|nr:D-cysteine desulfhydrase family protein [Parvibaculum sedimenti]KAB7741579.1 pyridoxal-phosphate dependent enzyme [Parvibaculum sedimenti]